ncbi:MAG: bifunctional methylenetetrahydrofolate dehydrogenase/methenyltetrahydrofolate cyclohydrolase FolD [Candidatus Latescibacteria bacterium]|nr:bifunctional methylenetetrahydrofolate dehydrogenase/methenyltetrahydrofolate cyclohydrolase FolD [Candidatus Latescibacterota bacterium]
MQAEMKKEVQRLKDEHGLVPGLAVVLVGDNPASVSYVTGKHRDCAELGIHSVDRRFDADLSEEDLLEVVAQFNADDSVHGILVQLPLPGQDETRILNAVDPDKDVDGLHPVNLGRLMRGEEGFLPCTPFGVQQMLARSGIETAGKHVVMVGRGNLVGRPLANILTQKNEMANATVTLCHSGTRDLGAFTRQADILIVAAGHVGIVSADMVRQGAVVIDVGVNRVDDASRERGWRLVGDVDYRAIKKKASAITPVPGGVGPMTIAMLLYNTIWSAKRKAGLL